MSATISPGRTRLIAALDRIKVSQERPNLRIVGNEPRPKDYWRRRHNAFLKQQREDIRCKTR